MELMTVSEYANSLQVSVQTIYKRISKGTLEVKQKDGIKYIVTDAKSNKQPVKDDCGLIIKEYKHIIKELKKQIKGFKKEKDKNFERLEKLFDLSLAQQNKTKAISHRGEVTEAEIIKDKKKSKKKNRKKS